MLTLQAGIPEPDLVWYGKVLTTSGGITVRLTSGMLSWQIEPASGGTPWTLSVPLTNINDQFSFALRVPCESPEPAVFATSNTVVLTSPALTYGRMTVTLDGQPLTLQGAPANFTPTLADRGRAERIDLVLGTLPVDTDGDGMPDNWENLHFGAGGADPNDDFDGDGLSNLREFRAGTHPNDPQSVFEVVEVIAEPGGFRLRWSSVEGKSYNVRRAATLSVNPAAYTVVQANVPATSPINEWFDPTAVGGTYFYLLEVQP
jgi:hypothetical protein